MLRQLMRVTESVNLLSLFFVFFFVGKQSEGEQGSFLAEKKGRAVFWEKRRGGEIEEGKGEKRLREKKEIKGTETQTWEKINKKRTRYKGNTVPTTPVWKLAYKSHIQGQEEQSINVSVDSYLYEKRNNNYYDNGCSEILVSLT